MCGYVGFTHHLSQPQPILKEMLDTIAHRGPDGEGIYTDENIALGHRRLSFLDLSTDANQPMFNEDNSLVLVFNGEIYNFQELREVLIEQGHTFRNKSDSEVLLHLYEQEGVGMLNKLRGMFSFVIWDTKNKSLFAARDYFGIKPLYYALMNDTLFFGSEIKSFLPHPDFEKSLNHDMLEQYLTFQYAPGPDTFFEKVYKLQPAHYLLYQDGKLTTERYWEPVFEADESKSLEDWTHEIEEVMKDSVMAHKISDVEVGSFLSSGVDSSYVAALSDVDKTFTVGFSQEQYNEISYAKEFSSYIGVKNEGKIISPEEFWDHLPHIQYHMDEPLADPAAVALFFVSKEAAKQVKAAMSGEGADELFGGYNIYKEPLENTAFDRIPFFLRKLMGKIAGCFPKVRGFNYLVRHSKTLEERFIGNAFMFDEKEKNRLLKKRTATKLPTDITKPFYQKVQGKDPVTKMQYLDIHLWMAYDILLKADKMSMANSLEVRVPFLDKEVMAVASRIPTKYRVDHGVTKLAMRNAALSVMPDKTADKKKLGFPVPTRVWLREDKWYNVVKEYFTSPVAESFFQTSYLLKLLDQHKQGKYDNSRKIWTVFMFLVWYDAFFVQR